MKLSKTLLVVYLLVAVAVTAFGASFVHGPYTGAPSEESVTISWTADGTVPAQVEVGPRAGYEATGALQDTIDVPAPEVADRPTHVRIEHLQPNTEYVYRVVLGEGDGAVVSDVGGFATAPPPGVPVTFVVLADTQQQDEAINRLRLVGEAIAADPVPFDFVLHAGDVVESPTTAMWDDWFASFGPMLLRAPLLPVPGNHERNHRSYYNAFALPPGGGKAGEQWWALHWGDVVVVGLDSNVKRADQYRDQQAWATRHLSGDEPHKFVVFHHPVYSSDAYHGGGYSYDVIFHPIFVEAGVDVVFHGHAHNYERIRRDDVTYLVLGGGGAIPRPLAAERVDGSIVAIEDHHFYARVRTGGEAIEVDVVSVANAGDERVVTTPDALLDAFTLPEGRAGSPILPSVVWWILGAAAALVAFIVLRR